jgi:hypothetical protein
LGLFLLAAFSGTGPEKLARDSAAVYKVGYLVSGQRGMDDNYFN